MNQGVKYYIKVFEGCFQILDIIKIKEFFLEESGIFFFNKFLFLEFRRFILNF